MSKNSDKIRADFGSGDRKRDAGLTTPETIERFDDISYGSHPTWNLLDVYRPKKEIGNHLPVIAIVHGGAWVYGDKDVYQFYAMSLAERGFSVVNFSYRLAPEFKYPAALEDICKAFEWIYENADKYGFDTNNLFAVGDSAGAHLLTTFSNLYTNKAFEDSIKNMYPEANFSLPNGFKLNAVALNCGMYAFNRLIAIYNHAIAKDLLEKGGTSKELNFINAAKHITSNFPAAFVMTCPGDFLRSQARPLTKIFDKKNVPYVYKYYGSKEQKLYHVFHCNMREDMAKVCNDDECNFFKEHVKKN